MANHPTLKLATDAKIIYNQNIERITSQVIDSAIDNINNSADNGIAVTFFRADENVYNSQVFKDFIQELTTKGYIVEEKTEGETLKSYGIKIF